MRWIPLMTFHTNDSTWRPTFVALKGFTWPPSWGIFIFERWLAPDEMAILVLRLSITEKRITRINMKRKLLNKLINKSQMINNFYNFCFTYKIPLEIVDTLQYQRVLMKILLEKPNRSVLCYEVLAGLQTNTRAIDLLSRLTFQRKLSWSDPLKAPRLKVNDVRLEPGCVLPRQSPKVLWEETVK